MPTTYAIQARTYLTYKLLNSLFLGSSLGTVFFIYNPLQPATFSIGGIALAVATIALATQYSRILYINYFYLISLLVEIIILLVVILFLVFSISSQIALAVYIGYQVTFLFGTYLVRCETLLLPDNRILTKLDIFKQTGYLLGLGVSYLFYESLNTFYDITEKVDQVYAMHYPLLMTQVFVLVSLFLAFQKNKNYSDEEDPGD